MNELRQRLLEGQAFLGFEFEPLMLDRFEAYAQLLIEWNQKMNLTAITVPEEIAVKHFLDSLTPLSYINFPLEVKLADVGTGAGFPGLPLLIVRPDIKLTLIDSLNKRLTFLKAVCEELGLNAEFVHARGEEAGKMPQYREKYHFATARAVSHLRELSEYTLPLLKLGGGLISMKGPNPEKEIEEAQRAITTLGGKIDEVHSFTLPYAGERSLILINKISHTPLKYPRPSAKIAKFPLNR